MADERALFIRQPWEKQRGRAVVLAGGSLGDWLEIRCARGALRTPLPTPIVQRPVREGEIHMIHYITSGRKNGVHRENYK